MKPPLRELHGLRAGSVKATAVEQADGAWRLCVVMRCGSEERCAGRVTTEAEARAWLRRHADRIVCIPRCTPELAEAVLDALMPDTGTHGNGVQSKQRPTLAHLTVIP